MKKWLSLFAAVLGLAVMPSTLLGAATDGTVTFNVTLVDYGGNYAPRHIEAIWVTDGSGRFIKTLRRYAASRIQYLYQWHAAHGSYEAVDGSTGATISTFNPITVTWNCRDTNNVIVQDGDYRFYVEFTERNGQGYWTTNGVTFTKGSTPFTNNPANVGTYITAMSIAFVPATAPHDIAVTSLSPLFVAPNSNVTMTVVVTNKTTTAETFSFMLTNETSGLLVGTRTNVALAANAITNLTFTWNTTGLELGDYSFSAIATLATNESSTADIPSTPP